MLQKSSTLIGQLATVHICDWLTKVKQIYEQGMLIIGLIINGKNLEDNIPENNIIGTKLSKTANVVMRKMMTMIMLMMKIIFAPVVILI